MENTAGTSITAEERIKQIEREKRELKAQVMQEREAKKRAKQQKKEVIEESNSSVKETLNKILKAIYLYNKLSKNKRHEHNIFMEIVDIVKQNTKEEENGRI